MNILIILPSRNRREKCFSILKEYQDLSTHNSVRFILSCDEDDASMNNDEVKSRVDKIKNTDIVFNENKINIVNQLGQVQKSDFTTKIQAINSGAINQDFDICLLASDDMHPEIKGYDSIIDNDMRKYYPDTDGVLWYNDGCQFDKLNTLCILGKKYYDRFGYIYHPSYITLYCDDEFTRVSKNLGKCKYFDRTIIRHKHWCLTDNDNERDALDKKNDVFAGHDQQNFERRKAQGFK